jgi:hypothetical protein
MWMHLMMERRTRGIMNLKRVDKKSSLFLSHALFDLKRLIPLGLALVLSACIPATVLPTRPPATPLPVTPRQSIPALPSTTLMPTRVPTISLTVTMRVELPWPPQPTRTTFVPTSATGHSYQLTPWTPEKVEQLIEELHHYPETLPWADRGYLDSFYFAAYQYEGLAELEGALHFPQSDQAKAWQQSGAYNLYRSSNDDIASLYAGLIANALNQKETNLQDFEKWFAKATPLVLNTYAISPPKGYQKSLVLHIHYPENSDFSGGFAIWLLQKEGEFFTYPLPNEYETAYGDGQSNVEVVDVTGDGMAEVIVQNVDWQSFGLHQGAMKMYRLDQVPPREITLDPPLSDPSIAEWIVDQSQPVPTITFHIPVNTTSDMPCNTFIVAWSYQWQRDKLTFIQVIPPPKEAMAQDPMCTRTLVSRLGLPEYLKNRSALETYKQLLDLPFIAKVFPENGEPFLIEKARFNLALYLSSQGDESGASKQMQWIRDDANPSLTEWRKDAMTYFSVRRDPQALFQFCLASKKCLSFLNQIELIRLVPSSRFSEIETLLSQMGIDFHLSGNFDFDQDEQAEKWLLFRNTTGCGNSFWILAKHGNGISSRNVAELCLSGEVQEDEKVKIKSLAPSGGLTVYQVSVIGQEQNGEKFLYWPLDQEDPTIDINHTEQRIHAIQNKLLLRLISPAEAQKQIMDLQNRPLQPNRGLPHLQAQLLYLLGLSQELNGERTQAAQTYLALWQTFPDNPYAIMALAKLEWVR